MYVMKRNPFSPLYRICLVFSGAWFSTGLGTWPSAAAADMIASVPKTNAPLGVPATMRGIGSAGLDFTRAATSPIFYNADLRGFLRPGLFSPVVTDRIPAELQAEPVLNAELKTKPLLQVTAVTPHAIPVVSQAVQPLMDNAARTDQSILMQSVGQIQSTDESGWKNVIDALYFGRHVSADDGRAVEPLGSRSESAVSTLHSADSTAEAGAAPASVPSVPGVQKEQSWVGRVLSRLDTAFERAAARWRKITTRKESKALGVDLSAMDTSVRPQDDFFRYVNGTWLKTFKMPDDESSFGIFNQLYDVATAAVKKIIKQARFQTLIQRFSGDHPEERQIADLYKSFMNTHLLETRGVQPVAGDLAKIDAVRSKSELAAAFAQALAQGIDNPIGLFVDQDVKNNSAYITQLQQAGLGLPDREYYFEPEQQAIRQKYLDYLTALFTLSGEAAPRDKAQAVYALEEALAKHHWTQVEQRDVDKTYNKVAIRELWAMAGGFDWAGYLRAAGIWPEETEVIVAQPSYFAGFAQELVEQPLESWKLYMKARTLEAAAPYLSKAFVDASFEFNGRALNGQPKMSSRKKRGVSLVNRTLGEMIGRAYVEKHFPQSSLEHMQRLVENLRAAYTQRITELPWMSEETKKKALEKLKKILPKIGYPAKWDDYSQLELRPDDLLGNMRRANLFGYDRMVKRLGQPVDRGEWGMTPQTVNAYYNPAMNEIVFPAAILQAPFFDPQADDAANYGAIGAIIGHEMTHGFDDEGSHYDGDGVLRNWWTKADEEAFQARTGKLVQQFNAFEPLPGEHVNGQLTLGENIADLGGLTVAYRAYQLSLGGSPAPVIGGFTGEQRFFLSYAQAWRDASRDQALSSQIKNDPHSPAEYRVNGVVRNMPEFYKAFQVKAGDKLYQSEDDRVSIW